MIDLRTGRVSSVDKGKHTARVEFTDTPDESLVSHDLPVLVTRPGDYSLPDPGAAVVCLLAPGNEGIGYVLGVIYNEADAPPLNDAGKRSIVGDDLRLGASDATDPVALANEVKDRLDKIQQTFDAHIHTTTATIGVGGPGVISPPTSSVGALASVAAENVRAK